MHPPAQLRSFLFSGFKREVEVPPFGVPLRIVLRHMGWADNSSVKSLPRPMV